MGTDDDDDEDDDEEYGANHRFPNVACRLRSARPMKIIAVANQKGGVGKTTTSVNLAACLAVRGVRVLLIDLDPQANATSAFGLETIDNHSIYGPIVGLEEVSKTVIPTRFKDLWLIPGDLNLAGAEVEVARSEDHLTRLRSALEPLRRDSAFDVVLLDCPPSLGILMTNALAAADELLVPIQCEYFALEGLSKIVQIIDQIRASGANPDLRIGGILMTMFMRNNLAQQVINEVQTHFGDVIFKTVIPRTVRLSEAPSHGKTIIEYDPVGLGSAAYNALADEFLARGLVVVANPAAA
jgi:chromosome partitioning protein